MPELSKNMRVEDFDAHYYYADEIRRFAKTLGIKVGNFRKSDLEPLIREYLVTGQVPLAEPVLPRKKGQARDILAPDNLIENYVGDKTTKTYLLDLVAEIDPLSKDKSGQWYWLNDWRRIQQEKNAQITYRDLAHKLQELRATTGKLPPIPSARMNNFISEFLQDPENAGKPRDVAMQAWFIIKEMSGPKTYAHYKSTQSQ